MYKEFYSENKEAIRFTNLVILIITLIFLLAFYYFISNYDTRISSSTALLIITMVFLVGSPLYTLSNYVHWRSIRKIKNRNLGSYPFNEISKLGFQLHLKNKDSKWYMLSKFYRGKVNGYVVDCDVEIRYFDEYVLFVFKVKDRDLNTTEHQELKDKLEENRAYFDYNGIKRKFHYKNAQLRSIEHLEEKLLQFADLLTEMGFEAETKIED